MADAAPDAPRDGVGQVGGLEPTVVRVGGPAPYDVLVGRGITDRLPELVGEGVRQVALVHPHGLTDLAQVVAERLRGACRIVPVVVPDGEAAKTAAVAAGCWETMGAAGLTRSDAVVTVGGGATTDLGGFVAGTWMRGIRVVHVPTTLLAMVDAAVGGKTGIDTGAGKNLVGTFHEPSGVLCDLELLRSLPHPELVAGMAEVVKCGFVADPAILGLVDTDPGALDIDGPVLRELVERAVRVKADVVAADLRETGGVGDHPGREVLNYGHTMAHAIERASGYAVRHGEAVAVGCCWVAEVAREVGVLDDVTADRHRSAFAGVGLPTGWSGEVAGVGYDDLEARMRVDKKTRGDQLRLVVLHGLAQPRVLAGPPHEALRTAYDRMVGWA